MLCLLNFRPIPFLGTALEENRELPSVTEEIFLKKYGENFGTYLGMSKYQFDIIKVCQNDL